MDHSEGNPEGNYTMAAPSTVQRNRRRRRRRPSTMTTTATAAVAVGMFALSLASGEELRQPQPQHEQSTPELQRHHQQNTQSTLSKWRSLQQSPTSSSSEKFDYSTLRPLDLVLDETDPTHETVFQVGAGGFLEPYDFENYQVEYEVINLAEVGATGGVGGGGGSGHAGGAAGHNEDVHHKTSERVGFTNFDLNRGIGLEDEGYEASAEERELVAEESSGATRNLRGLIAVEGDSLKSEGFFGYTEENDPLEQEDYEIVDDLLSSSSSSLPSEDQHGRKLQSYHDKSSAQGFASGTSNPSNNSNGGIPTFNTYYSSSSEPAVVKAIFPPTNTAIGARQTFGALISGSMRNVCLQFKDHYNKRSDCFGLQNVGIRENNGRVGNSNNNRNGNNNKGKGGRHKGNNKYNANSNYNSGSGGEEQGTSIWELSFEGFEVFAGRRWQYRIRSLDTMRNRKSTPWRTFTIDAGAGSGSGSVPSYETQTAATEAAPPVTEAQVQQPVEKLTQEILDENWPHGGIVQTSTGRILFFFEDHPYVCSGTVLQEPLSDRTIILTAGHCAYQYRDIGGRFARHALFIPNQVDTTGTKSDEICTNDPLGCWIPAFAVVNYEWTINSFPHSVPWDYAFYVIPNDVTAHTDGFIHKNQPRLSKILEEIVEPMPIDFDWQNNKSGYGSNNGEFTHGLGYSFNKDPAFRYCATNMSSKYGISTYENLWLDSCKMTGGSSGGPWLKDTDSNGRGTVISVNSWGYSTSSGMAGPNFATVTGSKAECLFEVAKNTRFEDMVNQRGVVVDYC